MKRISLAVTGLFFILFSTVTFMSSCEVEHVYDAEITVINTSGNPMSGIAVTTNVNVNAPHVVYREGITDDDGKVSFSYNNIAILKVLADSEEYHGEGLLVLEEDKEVQLTVVVYN